MIGPMFGLVCVRNLPTLCAEHKAQLKSYKSRRLPTFAIQSPTVLRRLVCFWGANSSPKIRRELPSLGEVEGFLNFCEGTSVGSELSKKAEGAFSNI